MPPPAARHLARLLGDPPGAEAPVAELVARLRADPSRVITGLADEALASDDVTSLEASLAFVNERLVEMASLLPDDLRLAIALQAGVELRRRVPSADA